MTKSLKKPEFLLPFAPFFTSREADAYDQIPFKTIDSFGDEQSPALTAPTTWSDTAIAAMADAACPSLPTDLRSVEENTVPSWLWQHRGHGARRVEESDLRDIFNRAVGSAAAKAWKLRLFTAEKHARAFYDEARFALMQRHIAIAPDVLAAWGLDWAYGIETRKTATAPVEHSEKRHAISNASIDAALTKKDSPLWKKLFTTRGKEISIVALRLTDIAADWHSTTPRPAGAAIDVMALRHTDGSLNIDALRQATRILSILLDLQECADVTIGIANLAPLLMALGLGYDSDAGRAMAASIAALVTAEVAATSAETAGLRGSSAEFLSDADAILRGLRNHRRAVFGDGNDYEKLSVLPASLSLKNCPDLALVAEAQRRWDEALLRARAFGLRTTQFTDMTPSPILAVLMESASQGLEPMRGLTLLRPDDADIYRAEIHPAVAEAMARFDYPRTAIEAASHHIAGARSLRKAPAVNHASLRAAGIDGTAMEKIESYLPCVNSVRLAVTPWIIGVEFCRKQLKIAARVLENPRFDLLKHLGFTDADIDSANLHCYGHNTARNAKIINLRHRPLFACGTELSTEARMRMAAAVQSFISGDTGLTATLPAAHSIERGAEMTLAAWQRGLKSLTLVFDPMLAAPVRKTANVATRRIKTTSHAHAKPFAAPPRRSGNGKIAPLSSVKKENEKRVRGH